MSVARFWKEREQADTPARHPNELDLRRIERALKQRKRYRYVRPEVLPHESGYLVRSACCSRTIDPDGGEIDVALMLWTDSPPGWALMRRDHGGGQWLLDSRFVRLADLFDRLNADPDKQFWQ